MEPPRHIPANPPPPVDRDRLPQWTHAETKQFLLIRAELDRIFTQTKRNKPLWESISARMQLSGFSRTADQCKSKWKNLVTRFKSTVHFPFHDEMSSIFSQRMARILNFEEEHKGSKKKRKRSEAEEVVGEIGRMQREMEERWVAAAEAREEERRGKEEEWRRMMGRLEEERGEMERRWRVGEEERRAREEARDERRDYIVTAVVTELVGDR